MKHLRLMCFLAVIVFTAAVSLYSQAVNATLLGTITDASGAAVPNAKITITEVNTGVSRTVQTNESGNYTFSELPPGTYSVTAEQAGFKRAARTGVDVVVNT